MDRRGWIASVLATLAGLFTWGRDKDFSGTVTYSRSFDETEFDDGPTESEPACRCTTSQGELSVIYCAETELWNVACIECGGHRGTMMYGAEYI